MEASLRFYVEVLDFENASSIREGSKDRSRNDEAEIRDML